MAVTHAARDALIRLVVVPRPPVIDPDPWPVSPTVVVPVGPSVPAVVKVSPVNPAPTVDDIHLVLGDALDGGLATIASEIRAQLAENPGKSVRVQWWLE